MLTMGYSFRPWTHPKAISPGEDIREYITATARDEGIDRNIRFRHQIKRAEWSSETATWTVEAVKQSSRTDKNDIREEQVILTCNFLFCCAGYYRYSAGHLPEFPNSSRFKGQMIHPQAWPTEVSASGKTLDGLDYVGKRVVVIGSGATAVTLVPAMAKTAAHVTMLQRSPTYVVSRPAEDAMANRLRKWLPAMLAYNLIRWRNVLFGMWFFRLARKKPDAVKKN